MIFKRKKIFFSKKFTNKLKKLNSVFGYLFSIQILMILIIFLFYSFSGVKNRLPPERISNFFSKSIFKLTGFKFEDTSKYFLVASKGLWLNIIGNKLDNLDLSISQEGLIEIEMQRKFRQKVNQNSSSSSKEVSKIVKKMIRAELKDNKKKYKVKLRVKGDRKIHYNKKNDTSFKIDLIGESRLYGLEEFSLQKPIIRNYIYEYIFHQLLKDSGNIYLKYFPVNFSVNGNKRGVFVIEEGFTKYLLERNKRRNGPIYNTNDLQSGYYPDVMYDAFSEFNWVTENLDLLNSGFSVLNNTKDQKNFNKEQYFDWKLWARFFAIIDLTEGYHGALSKSPRLYYNPITSKIEPIGFDAHKGAGSFKNFILLDFLYNNQECSYICGDKPWFQIFFFKNDGSLRHEFLNEYLNYLKLISDENYISNFLNKNNGKIKKFNDAFYSDMSRSDKIFWKGFVPYIYDNKFLYERAKLIKSRILNQNLENIKLSLKNDTLSFNTTTSLSPIRINLNCKNSLLKKPIWIFGKGSIKWNYTCKDIKISNINNKNNEKDYYLFENPKLSSDNLPINFKKMKLLSNHENILKNKNFLTLTKDDLEIKHNYLIKKNEKLIIKEGQKIIIKENSTLFSKGDLTFLGNSDNPNYIVGDEKSGNIVHFDGNIKIGYLIISNLREPKQLNGYKLYGGINLINSKIDINKIIIQDSISEDAINFINSTTKLNEIFIKNSSSDAIDVDGGIFKFKRISCHKIGNDCLDTSNAIIKGEKLLGENILDKSISIGENSNVSIQKVNIKNSEIGVAVKDGSKMVVKHLNLKNTSLPIAVFQKKTEYTDFADLNVKNINLENSNEIFLVDKNSSLILENKKIYGTKSGEKIEKLLYGNIYGRETIR